MSAITAFESNFITDRYTGLTPEEADVVICALNQIAVQFLTWSDANGNVHPCPIIITPYLGPVKVARSIQAVITPGVIEGYEMAIRYGSSVQMGRVGEFISRNLGYSKNTDTIRVALESGGYRARIPDHLQRTIHDSVYPVIGETKTLKYFHYSTQIKHDQKIAEQINVLLPEGAMKYEVHLLLPKNARVSAPLQAEFDAGRIFRGELEVKVPYTGPLPKPPKK